jgi:hypothetical protein
MKLSKILYIIPALALLASCDNINEDDRLIEIDAVVPQRAVLLEEFTGQWCRNCPAAHAIIKQLKEQYGDAFIPVSIHAGTSANAIPESESIITSNPKYIGLKTEDGDAYAEMWGINSFPNGVLDRTSGVIGRDKWAGYIVDELKKESNLQIELTAGYDATSNSISIHTQLKPIANISGKLQLWIVESGIVTIQQNGESIERDYVHDHVFRATVNTIGGEAVTLSDNVYSNYTHSISVKDIWTPANLSVVAFVYDDSGVLQAAETNVVTLDL